MTRIAHHLLAVLLIVTPVGAHALFGDKQSPEEERKEIQAERDAALDKLYRETPGAKAEIQSSRGYAVFSNVGVNIGLISSQRGGGILRDNRNGKDTYMKMFSAGGGMGLGIKDFSAIFIFQTDEALDMFVSEGWDFSGQADANLESESEGEGLEGAATAMPGTKIYQLTDAVLALQVTLQGTKFWADEDLN